MDWALNRSSKSRITQHVGSGLPRCLGESYEMVRKAGYDPATSCTPSTRSAWLSYVLKRIGEPDRDQTCCLLFPTQASGRWTPGLLKKGRRTVRSALDAKASGTEARPIWFEQVCGLPIAAGLLRVTGHPQSGCSSQDRRFHNNGFPVGSKFVGRHDARPKVIEGPACCFLGRKRRALVVSKFLALTAASYAKDRAFDLYQFPGCHWRSTSEHRRRVISDKRKVNIGYCQHL